MWNVGLGVDFLTGNRVDHGDFIVRFSNLKKNKHLSHGTDDRRHAGSLSQDTRLYVVTS